MLEIEPNAFSVIYLEKKKSLSQVMNNALIHKNKKGDKLKHDHCSFLISVSVEVISKKMFNYEILPIIFNQHPKRRSTTITTSQ